MSFRETERLITRRNVAVRFRYGRRFSSPPFRFLSRGSCDSTGLPASFRHDLHHCAHLHTVLSPKSCCTQQQFFRITPHWQRPTLLSSALVHSCSHSNIATYFPAPSSTSLHSDIYSYTCSWHLHFVSHNMQTGGCSGLQKKHWEIWASCTTSSFTVCASHQRRLGWPKQEASDARRVVAHIRKGEMHKEFL